MRTNIVLDEKILDQVMKDGNFPTKRSAVEAGLKMLMQFQAQQKIRSLQGKIRWEGDLESMRLDRPKKRRRRAAH